MEPAVLQAGQLASLQVASFRARVRWSPPLVGVPTWLPPRYTAHHRAGGGAGAPYLRALCPRAITLAVGCADFDATSLPTLPLSKLVGVRGWAKQARWGIAPARVAMGTSFMG